MAINVQVREDPRTLALLERIAGGVESIATAIGASGVDQDAEAGIVAEHLNAAADTLTKALPT